MYNKKEVVLEENIVDVDEKCHSVCIDSTNLIKFCTSSGIVEDFDYS